MTLDIQISYDHTTRRLSTGRCNEVIGGTYGDANSTRLVFTITGITDTYTVRCALGSPVHSGHDVDFPEYTLEDNTFIIPGELMSSALHGEIPVQLHFTTATEEWYSENCVKLKILPAIRGKDLEIIPPVPRPESDIVTDVTYDGDITLTIHYAEAQQKQIQLNIVSQADPILDPTSTHPIQNKPVTLALYDRAEVPEGYSKIKAAAPELVLDLTPHRIGSGPDLILATKEYVDAHSGGFEGLERTFTGQTWTWAVPDGVPDTVNIQTYVKYGNVYYEAIGDISYNARTIVVKFNESVTGKIVIS